MSSRPFPFDARIAELPRAMDGSIVGALFGQYVYTADNEPMAVEHCRVARLRYRPEDRCVVQYAVDVAGTSAGGPRRELVIGTLYADPRRAARRAKRLPGVTFIPELRMLVSVFPSDRKLPQAPTLLSGADAALKGAMLRAFGGGKWREQAWEAETVRYREGLSLVVRYTVRAREADTGEVRDRVFYAKTYPDTDSAPRMFEQLERLAQYSAATALASRIDRPIACLEHLRTVLSAATPGRPLTEMLATAGDCELLTSVKAAARAVARFNLSDAPLQRQFSTAEYCKSLRRPAELLGRACPGSVRDLQHILAAARELPDVERRPTHRDMKPEHVLIRPGGTAFIDLDSSAAADPALDVALMLARFAALAIVDQRPERIRAAAAAFAHQYFACVPATWRRHLSVYYAASLMDVAAGLFHRQEDDWRTNVPALLGTSSTTLLEHQDLSVEAIGLLTEQAGETARQKRGVEDPE